MPKKHETSFIKILQSLIKFVSFILIFLFAISFIKESLVSVQLNYDLVNLLKINELKPIHYLMIGWLGTIVFTRGSPVAAMAITFAVSGLIDVYSMAMLIIGSRVGPDLVLLILGIFQFFKSHKIQKGLFIPILEFFSTSLIGILTYISFPITFALDLQVKYFFFDFSNSQTPIIDIIGNISKLSILFVGEFITFIFGGFLFFIALKIFDSIIETDAPKLNLNEQINTSIKYNLDKFFETHNFSYLLYNPILSFFLGIIITAMLTTSSGSVSLLIPLYATGKLPLSTFIAFILGSNIGTLSDTMVIAILTNNPEIIRGMTLLALNILLTGFICLIFMDIIENLSRKLENATKTIIGLIFSLLIMCIPPILVLIGIF